MKARSAWVGALSALTLLCSASLSTASSHRDAPAISDDPTADNTDVWAWVEGGNLVIVAAYNPLEEPAGGPNFHGFSDDVLYRVNLARGPSDLDEDLSYEIRFTTSKPAVCDPNALPATGTAAAQGCEFFYQIGGRTQTYSVTKIEGGNSTVLITGAPVAPANIGPRTNSIAYQIPAGTSYEEHFVANPGASNVVKTLSGGEGRVFAGPRDDGFYVDLGAGFDLAGLCPVLGCIPRDNVAGYNAHAIALEIPLAKAKGSAVTPGASNDNLVGIWATASRRKMSIMRADGSKDSYGPWVQVSRLGLPLINEAVIGLQDKDKYSRTHPKDDVANFGGYILNPVLVRDAEFAGFYAAGGPLAPFAANLATLKAGRADIAFVINLNDIPSAGAHTVDFPGATGDVLRVDLGVPSGFPNGRPLYPGTNAEDDVTDVELSLILTGNPAAGVGDGVSNNDATYPTYFPYLPPPWEGASQGHGVP